MRLLKALVLIVVVLLLALAGFGAWWSHTPVVLRQATVDFRVVPGSTLRAAAQQVAEAGVDVPPALFVLLGRVLRVDTAIKAGSYSVSSGITPLQLLRKLTAGDVSLAELRLLEGWTFRQWREKLDAHPDLVHETQGLSEAAVLARLGLTDARAEGLFFPDTYLFDKQSSDLELLARAHRAMQSRLAAEWQTRAAGLPYKTPYQALIMASIIEKETGRESERSLVAAVFINRLRTGMLLQTDPTVIYGLGEAFDGNLRKRDLQTDTPYNTYTRAGLPPSPIAMPGVASLKAALNPAREEVYYFVGRGDGSSQFSRTLDEHNRAVNRYQRGRQ
ncbi:MAG TPA: endolytic transglycosylase MltG [Rhodocyclaceae bacterium]|nr:endolytic transglycosylase MltG [Rhodocyclaceae bacterium]